MKLLSFLTIQTAVQSGRRSERRDSTKPSRKLSTLHNIHMWLDNLLSCRNFVYNPGIRFKAAYTHFKLFYQQITLTSCMVELHRNNNLRFIFKWWFHNFLMSQENLLARLGFHYICIYSTYNSFIKTAP